MVKRSGLGHLGPMEASNGTKLTLAQWAGVVLYGHHFRKGDQSAMTLLGDLGGFSRSPCLDFRGLEPN